MRIKSYIASSGAFWHPRFPKLKPLSNYFPRDGEGGKERFDLDLARQDLKDEKFFTWGGNDTEFVRCATVLLVDAVNAWMVGRGSESEKAKAKYEVLKGKEETENESRCDIDILPAKTSIIVRGKTITVPTVRIRVRTTRCWAVEQEPWEKVFAGIIVKQAQILSEKMVKVGNPPFVFDPSVDECLRVLDELNRKTEEKHEIARLNGNRIFCKNYCHGTGYCSPANMECRCYGPLGKCYPLGNDGKIKLCT